MRHTFTSTGMYVDSEFETYTQNEELHIVQRNIEKESRRTYDVGRVVMNADEFFEIYTKLALDRETRFDMAAQYATALLNMNGKITIQSARELWRIATHQVNNFLILCGNTEVVFSVLAVEDSVELLRLKENFGERVAAACHRGKIEILRRGFK